MGAWDWLEGKLFFSAAFFFACFTFTVHDGFFVLVRRKTVINNAGGGGRRRRGAGRRKVLLGAVRNGKYGDSARRVLVLSNPNVDVSFD